MKATSKYGSAYPRAASSNATRLINRRKAVASDAPLAASSTDGLKLPHERDESIDEGGGGVVSESVKQAGRDVQRGLPDTDRGAEMHRTYQRQKI